MIPWLYILHFFEKCRMQLVFQYVMVELDETRGWSKKTTSLNSYPQKKQMSFVRTDLIWFAARFLAQLRPLIVLSWELQTQKTSIPQSSKKCRFQLCCLTRIMEWVALALQQGFASLSTCWLLFTLVDFCWLLLTLVDCMFIIFYATVTGILRRIPALSTSSCTAGDLEPRGSIAPLYSTDPSGNLHWHLMRHRCFWGFIVYVLSPVSSVQSSRELWDMGHEQTLIITMNRWTTASCRALLLSRPTLRHYVLKDHAFFEFPVWSHRFKKDFCR